MQIIRPTKLRAALALAVIISSTGGAAHAQATQSPIQERPAVQPQIDIAGTGIATLDLSKNGTYGSGNGSNSQINISDSGLVVSASQRLYNGGIGSFSLGGLTLDQSNSGTTSNPQFFLHQAFADYQTRDLEAYIGRTDNPTAQFVTFPTLRGDDLVDFTFLNDPYSDGKNLEEQRYSNVAAVTFNQGLTHFENFHVQHLIDSAGIGGSGGTGLNSYGASYQYQNTPTLDAIQRIVSYGVGFEHRPVSSAFGGKSDALYAGGVINLRPSLTDRVDLRLLDNYTFGNNTKTFTTVGDTYRADANTLAASLRYLHSPFGIPGYQVSLTAGYKTFDRVSGANELGLQLTGVKRLGDGFDAVAQVGYARRSGAIVSAFGQRDDTVFQIGLSYNFDSIFNQQVGPRRTPLNMLHSYIPD